MSSGFRYFIPRSIGIEIIGLVRILWCNDTTIGLWKLVLIQEGSWSYTAGSNTPNIGIEWGIDIWLSRFIAASGQREWGARGWFIFISSNRVCSRIVRFKCYTSCVTTSSLVYWMMEVKYSLCLS